MPEIHFRSQSPKKIDGHIAYLLDYLGIDKEQAVRLKYSKPTDFDPEPDNCHLNVWCQIKRSGGEAQHGWIIGQDKARHFSGLSETSRGDHKM